ncbi:MAG: Tfp pilus assembly protein FimT [Verrucomicrobiales bacterium]|nr:Tfp pilus assembly protein FimT [Verrucomicrobiales bacterium]
MRASLQQHNRPPAGSHPAGRRVAAFTLMELMVVIALIAIMTAVIVPEMKGTFEDALLRSTARDLVSAVELANSRAVSGNQSHRLRIDSRSHQFTIEKQVPNGSPDEFIPLEDVIGCQGKLDERIVIESRERQTSDERERPDANLSSSPDGILFQSDGTAEARDLVLEDRTGHFLTLRINPITSRVRILAGKQE